MCPFSQFSCYLQEISEDTSVWLGLSPIDTVIPHCLLMLWNCFLDFAVEHWVGCRATEPGFPGDIGAIQVWLIDWLIPPRMLSNLVHSRGNACISVLCCFKWHVSHVWCNLFYRFSSSTKCFLIVSYWCFECLQLLLDGKGDLKQKGNAERVRAVFNSKYWHTHFQTQPLRLGHISRCVNTVWTV